jgi:pyochelin biosynthesis protein PchC
MTSELSSFPNSLPDPGAAAVGRDAIRVWRRAPRATWRLVCFPHAGGSAGFFRPWAPLMHEHVDLLAVQYPGREDRLDDPRPAGLAELADRVALDLLRHADRPLALFGHSLGATLAYEVAQRLSRYGLAPERLFVSAQPAPPRRRVTRWHLESDEALCAEVVRLSPSSHFVLNDPECRPVFLPLLRQDYQWIETYAGPAAAHHPLRLQIEVFLPAQDTEITLDEAQAWQQCSVLPVQIHPCAGDHFYLNPLRHELVARVMQSLRGQRAQGTNQERA